MFNGFCSSSSTSQVSSLLHKSNGSLPAVPVPDFGHFLPSLSPSAVAWPLTNRPDGWRTTGGARITFTSGRLDGGCTQPTETQHFNLTKDREKLKRGWVGSVLKLELHLWSDRLYLISGFQCTSLFLLQLQSRDVPWLMKAEGEGQTKRSMQALFCQKSNGIIFTSQNCTQQFCVMEPLISYQSPELLLRI